MVWSRWNLGWGWIAATLIVVCTALHIPRAHADRVIEIRSARDLEALFVRMNYAPKDWQAGVRTVPRIYLADIPSSWRQKGSKEITVAEKKNLFFRVMAPIILYVNERILVSRARAEALARDVALGRTLSPADLDWLRSLAKSYEVAGAASGPMSAEQLAELLRRVDIIPPSLALAQSASESGWGTSRFADEGNSLFGQWSWSGGIKPAEQRAAVHGDHRVAAFESTGMSVWSYELNLNTHAAYRDLRLRREELRRRGQPVRGQDVVDSMIRYSERGQVYVDELKALMRQNHLDTADEARLMEMEIIRVVPKR